MKSKKKVKTIVSSEESLFDILKKKAYGYEIEETIEEYSKNKELDDLELVKKKVTKKYVPPDLSAVKILIDIKNSNENEEFENLTLDELEKESELIKSEIIKYENLLKGEVDGDNEV